jgi:hypothetical protein
MELFFKKLLWPSLVIALIELIFVQSQPHWLFVTLIFAILNALALFSLRFIMPQPAARRLS